MYGNSSVDNLFLPSPVHTAATETTSVHTKITVYKIYIKMKQIICKFSTAFTASNTVITMFSKFGRIQYNYLLY